jgi:PKD repeat protein
VNIKSVLSICASTFVLTLAAGILPDAVHADPIDCNTTPFGKGVQMIRDDEFLSLHDGSSNQFGEYRLPFAGEHDPLPQVYSSDLIPAGSPVAGATFLTATNVDLNGDGRDEAAVAYSMPSGTYGKLMIAIFERQPGFAPSAQLLKTWTLDLNGDRGGAGAFNPSVALKSGDFIGSKTRQQQLALMWRSHGGNEHGGDLNVIVLTGAADGSIAQADNAWAGRWESPNHQPYDGASLTTGDFLLDGRDQIAVVSNLGGGPASQTLYYDLLEFNGDGLAPAVNGGGLPVNTNGVDSAIGSKEFASSIATFADDAFDPANLSSLYCPIGFGPCTERPQPSAEPDRIVASGGDVVDSAAAELMVHLSFLANLNVRDKTDALVFGSPFGQYLGQRLVHFAVTQAVPGGDISAVRLANSNTAADSSRDFDSSQILGTRSGGVPGTEATKTGFDAAIGAVDGQEKQSVALVHVINSGFFGQLETDLYKASVRLNAGFQFTVHGAFGPFPVDFANTSTGDVQGVSWDFGDGAGSIAVNPSHSFNSTGTYTVKLTVTDSNNKTSTYSTSVAINGQASTGGAAASYSYQMTTTPVYSAATANPVDIVNNPTQCNSFGTGAVPHIAIGDMDRDGFAEIMTTAQSIQFTPQPFVGCSQSNPLTNEATIWRSLWRVDPTTYAFAGTHAQQVTATGILSTLPYSNAVTVASDFDGDSVFAKLGSDCRAVSEPQLRDLVWMPPFFQAMQSGSLDSGFIAASFGINEKSGSGTENRSGSFTGNSVSGYVGIGGEYSSGDKPWDFKFAASLKVTAGHDWQSEHGAIHGSDVEYDYSEGQSASVGEALVVAEADDANCYSYDTVQSGGPVPDSSLRMCQITYQERTALTAETWNNQSSYAGVSPNWVPLQRDWASLAMFRTPASTIPFTVGKEADKATDGLFSTSATSVTTTNPYLDIDLGQVQGITSIRVFPAANKDANGNLILPLSFTRAMPDLQGFRLYVSATPFTSPDVPAGPGVSVFTQGANDDQIYDRWNVFTVDTNLNPLRGRYVRLQYPGQSPARINIAQIQVFGDTHLDPPAFPDAVCQPVAGTGYFLARVWNPVARGYQNIEERGDLMWSGTNGRQQPTGVTLGGQPCRNHTDVRETTIWNNLRIGNTGITNSWDSTSDTTNTVGSYGSFESATRVGAELETEIGTNALHSIEGISYEYTFGVNSDSQTTSFWGNGLQIGGAVGGFDQPFQNLVLTCGYFPHPYSYHLAERGNSSYQHDLYVVDYIVHQPTGGSAWQRGAVPLTCTGQDEIFKDGFGNNSREQP